MSEQWYYQVNSAMGSEPVVGPLNSSQLRQVAARGGLKKSDFVLSPTKTKNAWVPVHKLSALVKLIDQAKVANKEARRFEAQEEDAEKQVAQEADKRSEPPALPDRGTYQTAIAQPETKVCPWCAETVKFQAKKCRHCGEMLTEGAVRIANLSQETVEIAKSQKAVIYAILAQLVSLILLGFTGPVGTIVYLAVLIVSAVFILRLCIATMGPAGIVLWLVSLIPLLGLFALLIASGTATSKLKSAGLTVGFLGVDTSQLP